MFYKETSENASGILAGKFGANLNFSMAIGMEMIEERVSKLKQKTFIQSVKQKVDVKKKKNQTQRPVGQKQRI